MTHGHAHDGRTAATHIWQGFAWLASGEFVARAVGFATTLYLARTLDLAGYGQLEVGLAVFSYLQLIVDGGLETIAVRSVSRRPEARHTVASHLFAMRVVVACVLGLAVWGGTAAWPGPDGVRPVLLRYALAMVPLVASVNWAFQADRRMSVVAARNAATQVVYALLVVLLVHGPLDVLRVPSAFAVAVAVGVGLTLVAYAKQFGRVSFGIDATFARGLARQALPVAASSALRAVSYNFDILIIGLLYPALGVGLYGAAYRLLTLPLLGYATLSASLFPTLVRLEPAARRRFMTVYGALVVISSLVVAALMRIGAADVLRLAAGARFEPAAPVLALLAVSIPLTAGAGVLRQLLLATDRQQYDLLVVVLGAVSNAGLNLLLIPRLGLAGAAIATISGEAVVLVAAVVVAFVTRGPSSLVQELLS